MALLRLHTRDVLTSSRSQSLTRFPFHWLCIDFFCFRMWKKNVLEIVPRLILNNCELSKFFSFPTSLGLITHSLDSYLILSRIRLLFRPFFPLLLRSQLNSIFPRSLVFTSVLHFDETPTAVEATGEPFGTVLERDFSFQNARCFETIYAKPTELERGYSVPHTSAWKSAARELPAASACGRARQSTRRGKWRWSIGNRIRFSPSNGVLLENRSHRQLHCISRFGFSGIRRLQLQPVCKLLS